MLDILKVVRYLVFVIFIICNAVITSVAVWNLSIVQAIALDSTSKQVDAYLIFVGVSGLFLVFPLLFIELFGKETFFSKVWFELSWVGLFWVLELVGASTITSQSNSNLCNDRLDATARANDHDSPCTSAQVLQAFTWICAIILFGYFSLLAISTVLRFRTDPAILTCSVRKFPWSSLGPRQLSSTPQSPSRDKFHDDDGPRIVAPKPHRLTIPFGEAFASYSQRRGINQDYDIEQFQFPAQFDEKTRTNAPGPSTLDPRADVERPFPTTFDDSMGAGPSAYVPPQPTTIPEPALMRTLAPVRPSALYPSHVQNAAATRRPPVPILGTPSPPPAPAPAPVPAPVLAGPPLVTIPVPPPRSEPPRPSALRLLPPTQPRQQQPPRVEPDPLGEWPRLDAVTRPVTTKVKRKPLPLPHSNSNPPPAPAPAPQHQSHASYTFDPTALAAALEPLASPTTSSRFRPSLSRPTGPRIRSSSSGGAGDVQSNLQLQPQRRPPNLDLSNISNHRSS